MTLTGGIFDSFHEEPYAIILDNEPRPLRRWCTPTEEIENLFKGEVRNINYSFVEYGTSDDFIYIFTVEDYIMFPSVSDCLSEFLLKKNLLKKRFMN
jgi:hypothetical protein